MQEPYRSRLEPAGVHGPDHAQDFGILQRQQNLAVGRDPLVNGQPVPARNQRLRQFQVEVVLFEAVFRAHLDDVAKTLRGYEYGAGAAALDEGVGHKRRAVNDLPDAAGRNAGATGRGPDAFKDCRLGLGLVGQHLACREPARMLDGDVGECSADIDAGANCCGSHQTDLTN